MHRNSLICCLSQARENAMRCRQGTAVNLLFLQCLVEQNDIQKRQWLTRLMATEIYFPPNRPRGVCIA